MKRQEEWQRAWQATAGVEDYLERVHRASELYREAVPVAMLVIPWRGPRRDRAD